MSEEPKGPVCSNCGQESAVLRQNVYGIKDFNECPDCWSWDLKAKVVCLIALLLEIAAGAFLWW